MNQIPPPPPGYAPHKTRMHPAAIVAIVLALLGTVTAAVVALVVIPGRDKVPESEILAVSVPQRLVIDATPTTLSESDLQADTTVAERAAQGQTERLVVDQDTRPWGAEDEGFIGALLPASATYVDVYRAGFQDPILFLEFQAPTDEAMPWAEKLIGKRLESNYLIDDFGFGRWLDGARGEGGEGQPATALAQFVRVSVINQLENGIMHVRVVAFSI
jgi:hypothetical protein